MNWTASHGHSVNVYLKYCFWIFVFLYCALILYKPAFGIIDDHLFVPAIFVGHRLPFYMDLPLARFAPLEGQEYNLVAILSSTAFSFYLLNAVELIVIAWLLVKIAKSELENQKSSVPYLVAAAIMLTPGFINAWLRLLIPERSECILLGIFLLCFVKFQREQKSAYYVVGIIAAGLAMLCKETAFILFGGIGLAHLLLDRKSKNKGRLFDISLMGISALWIGVYYCFIYRFRGTHLYGGRSGSFIHLVLQTLAYNILLDPAVTIGIFVLLSVRIFVLIRRDPTKRDRIDPLFDSVLLSGCFFFFAYLILRMSSTYYLLPLYIFATYAISKTLSHPPMKNIFRPWVVALLWILVASEISLGLQEVTIWKLAPPNFQATLSFLCARESKSPARMNMFLAGVNKESDIYGSMTQYLSFDGLGPDKIELKSDIPVDQPTTYDRATGQETIDHIAPGDYILITPFDIANRRSEFEDAARYKLIFRTNSFSLPDVSIKVLIRPLLLRKGSPIGGHRVDPNFFVYERIAS